MFIDVSHTKDNLVQTNINRDLIYSLKYLGNLNSLSEMNLYSKNLLILSTALTEQEQDDFIKFKDAEISEKKFAFVGYFDKVPNVKPGINLIDCNELDEIIAFLIN